MNLFFDIESIPTTDPAVIERIASTIKPPGTLKKQESIDKWIAEEKASAIDEAVKKTSFDGTYGKIVCIGWALEDTLVASWCHDNERELLTVFFDSYRSAGKLGRDITCVGHNIIGFDLKFLWKRCVILGIRPPPLPFKAKPWDSSVFDSMLQWDSDVSKRISLDNLCHALGVKSPKGEMDGSMVSDAFNAGRFDDIAKYCAQDVEAVRDVYRRMTFHKQMSPITPKSEGGVNAALTLNRPLEERQAA